MLTAETPLRYLKGVGPKRAEALEAEGRVTVEDLLYVFPFRWEDRSAFARVAGLRPGQGQRTLDVRVASARLTYTRTRGFSIFKARLADDSGAIDGLWYNQPYLARVLVPGRRVVVFGAPVLDRHGKAIVLENPETEVLADDDAEGIHTGRIVPVYRKLAGLSSRVLRARIADALATVAPRSLPPTVPPEDLARLGLPERLDALRATHFPPRGTLLDDLQQKRTAAQRSLAFEEMFILQVALALRRSAVEREPRRAHYVIDDALRARLAKVLPFPLTEAQKRVLREIGADLRGPHPMNRLLQGDVGSGKTIVALLTLLVAVENGHQGALMAPTEILAEQHYRAIHRIVEGRAPWRAVLLTGSKKAGARRAALQAIASGDAHLAVGTHALFEKGVAFRDLALVVVDEQHRFGVMQRAALAGKGARPDALVMTATPIPRSLALTVYGDLDLSVIDELPPGRVPVKTVVRAESDRERVYRAVRQEVARGRQAYVVVPLVEETATSDLKAATAFAKRLQEGALSGLSVGLLHGKLRGEEKDRIMTAFAAGGIDVLVATTVVEVGVDVPNASVMIVEHAERFGLAQLHQLRGRVGRGTARSYCVLMVGGEDPGRVAASRLRIMSESSDGFRIAEHDLELRGPGAVFGTQQHGLTDLQFLAVVLRDPGLLDNARSSARAFVGSRTDAAPRLLASLRPGWQRRLGLSAVG